MSTSEVVCSRCGQRRAPATDIIYAGTPLGEQISKKVCQECWLQWDELQLKLINEYKLNPVLKEHRQFLVTQMKQFLGLE